MDQSEYGIHTLPGPDFLCKNQLLINSNHSPFWLHDLSELISICLEVLSNILLILGQNGFIREIIECELNSWVWQVKRDYFQMNLHCDFRNDDALSFTYPGMPTDVWALDEHGFSSRLACTDVNNWDNLMSRVIFLYQSMIFLVSTCIWFSFSCMLHGPSWTIWD